MKILCNDTSISLLLCVFLYFSKTFLCDGGPELKILCFTAESLGTRLSKHCNLEKRKLQEEIRPRTRVFKLLFRRIQRKINPRPRCGVLLPFPRVPGPWQAPSASGLCTWEALLRCAGKGAVGRRPRTAWQGKHGVLWGRARQPGVSRHNLVRQKYTPRAVTKGKRGHRMHSWKGESERGSGVMPAPLGMANAGTGGGAQRLHGTLTVTVGSGAPRMGRRKGVGNMG